MSEKTPRLGCPVGATSLKSGCTSVPQVSGNRRRDGTRGDRRSPAAPGRRGPPSAPAGIGPPRPALANPPPPDVLQRAQPSRGRRGVWGLGWEAPCLSGFYKLLGQQERRICKYTSYSKFCYYKFIHGPSRVRRQKSDPGPTESLRRMKNSTLGLGDPSPASGAGVGSGRDAGGERRPERSSQVLNSGRGPPEPPPATAPPRAPWGPLGAAQARGGRAAEGPGAEATSARPLGGPGGAGLVSVSPEPRF